MEMEGMGHVYYYSVHYCRLKLRVAFERDC